jgi:hypothetical protein
MANPNTAIGVGIRRDISGLGMRNFEPDGGVQYASNHDGLVYAGTTYNTGQTISYDGTLKYLSPQTMEVWFNMGWIYPLT